MVPGSGDTALHYISRSGTSPLFTTFLPLFMDANSVTDKYPCSCTARFGMIVNDLTTYMLNDGSTYAAAWNLCHRCELRVDGTSVLYIVTGTACKGERPCTPHSTIGVYIHVHCNG